MLILSIKIRNIQFGNEVLYNKNSNIEPGKVLFVDDCGITVKTADASIKLKKIEPKINILEGAYL